MNSLDKSDFDKLFDSLPLTPEQKENTELRAQLAAANKLLAEALNASQVLRNELAAANKRIEEAEKQDQAVTVMVKDGYIVDIELNTVSFPEDLADGGHKFYAKPIPPADVAELQRRSQFWVDRCGTLEARIAELERKIAKLNNPSVSADQWRTLAETNERLLKISQDRCYVLEHMLAEQQAQAVFVAVRETGERLIEASGKQFHTKLGDHYQIPHDAMEDFGRAHDAMLDTSEELQKLLSREREKAVPEGWQLIPIDSTPEILKAMRDAIALAKRISSDEATLAYGAIFPAAPSPASLKAMTKWLPIKTAPKDGTVIDLLHAKYGRMCDAWWDDGVWSATGEATGFIGWMPIPDYPSPASLNEKEGGE